MKDLTFTENEAQGCADFINFVMNRAEWKINSKEAIRLNAYFDFMHRFQSKVDAHILELKKVDNPPPKEPKTKRKAKS